MLCWRRIGDKCARSRYTSRTQLACTSAPPLTRFGVGELIGAYRKKQIDKVTEALGETNPALQLAQDELRQTGGIGEGEARVG